MSQVGADVAIAARDRYSSELERVIGEHPAIAEIAVIGVPDLRWGEAVKAVVALRKGSALSDVGLIAYARAPGWL